MNKHILIRLRDILYAWFYSLHLNLIGKSEIIVVIVFSLVYAKYALAFMCCIKISSWMEYFEFATEHFQLICLIESVHIVG